MASDGPSPSSVVCAIAAALKNLGPSLYIDSGAATLSPKAIQSLSITVNLPVMGLAFLGAEEGPW
jgi:hypothetical protein